MSEQTSNIYPEDALAVAGLLDTITTSVANSLDEVFRERVRRSPDEIAYSQFDELKKKWCDYSWSQIAFEVERWQVAFKDQRLSKGDRVAICYSNSIEWVVFDQAALRLGLVVVPLYMADRSENIAYVINNSMSKLVLFESAGQWQAVAASDENLACLKCVLLNELPENSSDLVKLVDDWLPEQGQHLERGMAEGDDLASIVYTSGTMGRPKGVMLSHKNMLANAYSGMRSVALTPEDRLLSFLPLSHTLERTVGYYAPMLSGSSVSFNRSIPELSEDLLEVRPTVMISVPRIFERVHNQIHENLRDAGWQKRLVFKLATKIGWRRFLYSQGVEKWHPALMFHGLFDFLVGRPVRSKLGGNLNFVVVGGAPLTLDVAKTFISLGIPLLQGYGLTETSPVVSVNTLARNRPDSIGLPLRGVEVKLIENDELCVRGESVMQGYWRNPEATHDIMQGEWIRTGDRASIDEQGFIRIIGRIKEILVLANGEKVAPPDVEAAIMREPMIEQAMVVGEGKSFLAALLVINAVLWREHCQTNNWEVESLTTSEAQDYLLELVAAQLREFPGYVQIRKVHASFIEWTVDSDLMTPTLKIKRARVKEHFANAIEEMYEGHEVLKE